MHAVLSASRHSSLPLPETEGLTCLLNGYEVVRSLAFLFVLIARRRTCPSLVVVLPPRSTDDSLRDSQRHHRRSRPLPPFPLLARPPLHRRRCSRGWRRRRRRRVTSPGWRGRGRRDLGGRGRRGEEREQAHRLLQGSSRARVRRRRKGEVRRRRVVVRGREGLVLGETSFGPTRRSILDLDHGQARFLSLCGTFCILPPAFSLLQEATSILPCPPFLSPCQRLHLSHARTKSTRRGG